MFQTKHVRQLLCCFQQIEIESDDVGHVAWILIVIWLLFHNVQPPHTLEQILTELLAEALFQLPSEPYVMTLFHIVPLPGTLEQILAGVETEAQLYP